MAYFFMIRHKVKNFAEWTVFYKEHEPKRLEAGLRELYLLQGTSESPQEVVILFAAEDLQKAKEFTESKSLQDSMKKSGVLDTPHFYFLKK